MKPTKEIIELSKKLNELGYEQDKRFDTWGISSKGNNEWITLVCKTAKTSTVKRIPIPSLEDGLEWLRMTKGIMSIIIDVSSNCFQAKVILEYHPEVYLELSENFQANTSHEAVLKAMIKVLEK